MLSTRRQVAILVTIIAAALPAACLGAGLQAGEPAADSAAGAAAAETPAAPPPLPGPGKVYLRLDLHGIQWNAADLRGATFDATDLTGASLAGARLRGGVLRDCRLSSAVLTGADMAGVTLDRVDLVGADLAGAELAGATLNGVIFSPTGDRYTEATQAALNLIRKRENRSELSAALVAGMSGGVFSFVYNTGDPTAPTPWAFTANPVLTALQTAGCTAQLICGLAPKDAFALVTKTLKSGGVCLLPVSLAGRGPGGTTFEEPFWGVVASVLGTEGALTVQLMVPPFGALTFTQEELDQRWHGPWPTLEPAGAANPFGLYPVVVATPPRDWPDSNQMAAGALISANAIANEPRTYGALRPGAQGLRAAAADLQAVATQWDAGRAGALATWAVGFPRAYVGSRRQAAVFLNEIAPEFPERRAQRLRRLAMIYSSIAQVVEQDWVTPSVEGADAAKSFQRAAELVANVAAIEDSTASDLRLIVEGGGEADGPGCAAACRCQGQSLPCKAPSLTPALSGMPDAS
jgi:uncharacterized protein YjbI with pentapeptide repeats